MNSELYKKIKKGVIHVGAHTGQERDVYKSLGLNVLWIEAMPKIYLTLTENIKHYENQICYQQLISNVNDKEFIFHVANQSSRSSLLEFTKFHYSNSKFKHEEDIKLTSKRLDTFIDENEIDMSKYDAIVTDCQGADYFVLDSLGEHINSINFIDSEVMIKEIYKGLKDEAAINNLLKGLGFKKLTNNGYINDNTQRDNFYEKVTNNKIKTL